MGGRQKTSLFFVKEKTAEKIMEARRSKAGKKGK